MRWRVGAKLELHDLGLRTFAAFHVEWRAGASGCPKAFALLSGFWIVDALIQKTPQVASVDP
jgi:hypothetical protein